jgi:hypothetical protein
MAWNISHVLNVELVTRDKDLAYFLLVLTVFHIICFVIENTQPLKFTVYGDGLLVPQTVVPQEPNNWRVQVNKIRVNNIEKLMYLGSSIGVFVVGANLGFKAASFRTMYSELNLIFMVYLFSLFLSYWCNWICANTPGNPLEPNGSPPIDKNGHYVTTEGANTTVIASKNQGIVSPTRLGFVFWSAQWLLTISNLIQDVLLSYFSFGLVGAYTAAYPLGLLARSLGGV